MLPRDRVKFVVMVECTEDLWRMEVLLEDLGDVTILIGW